MDLERLQFLLDRHFDQTLTGDERTELSVCLLESARARDEFWKQARWHALIRQWGEAECGASVEAAVPARAARPGFASRLSRVFFSAPKTVRQAPRSRGWRLRWSPALAGWAFVGVSAVVVAVMVWTGKPSWTFGRSGLAVITHSADAVWESGTAPLRAGQPLGPGWVKLAAGAVQLDFARGARVVLEGPAQFQIAGDNEAFLQAGRMHAQVPPSAHGFTVSSPELTAVDLGTEFGLSVPKDGASGELHVFTGRVSVDVPNVGVRELQQSQAVRVDKGAANEIAARSDLFLRESELARRETAIARGRFNDWRRASMELSSRSDALVHLDFERVDLRAHSLPNKVDESSFASLADCSEAEGRWPGKGALEFKQPDARLRVAVPGEGRSLTLMAWVRLDSLPHSRNSLALSVAETPGGVHWWVREDGGLGIGLLGANGRWTFEESAPVLRRDLLGRWVFVAVTIDGGSGVATHYLNGRRVNAGAVSAAIVRPGSVDIGCWGRSPATTAQASGGPATVGGSGGAPGGCMDEFAAFSTALSDQEIRDFYEASKPAETVMAAR